MAFKEHAVLNRISYVYQLENSIEYQLWEYQQNVISVQCNLLGDRNLS